MADAPQRGSPLLPSYHGVHHTHSTFWPCVLNLSKAIIGAGTMAIPRAYYELGWVVGTASLVLVAGLTYWTLTILVNNSYRTGAPTYVALTRQLCGGGLALTLQAALLLFCFGFTVVYLVVMRDLLLGTPPACNGLLCEFLGVVPGGLVNPTTVMLGVVVGLVAPWAGFRDMGRLSFMNSLGLMAVLLLVAVAALLATLAVAGGQAATLPTWPTWGAFGTTPVQQWSHLLEVVPVLLACYVGHQNLHPLIPMLVPAKPATMNWVVAVSLTVAGVTFGVISLGAGLAFGEDVQVNVLSNLSAAGLTPLLGPRWALVATAAVQGGYLVSLLGSTLLYMYPLRTCLAELLCNIKAMLHPLSPPAANSNSNNTSDSNGVSSLTVTTDQPPQQQHPAMTLATAPGRAAVQVPAAAAADLDLDLLEPLLQPPSSHPPHHHHSSRSSSVAAFEARWFYWLTYGCLAAAGGVAVLVPNIWVALSAIGDIATTIEAFLVPGCIAMVAAYSAWHSMHSTCSSSRSSTGGGGPYGATIAAAAGAVGSTSSSSSTVVPGSTVLPSAAGPAGGHPPSSSSAADHQLGSYGPVAGHVGQVGVVVQGVAGVGVALLGVALLCNGVWQRS